jgi:hypothetical protein
VRAHPGREPLLAEVTSSPVVIAFPPPAVFFDTVSIAPGFSEE